MKLASYCFPGFAEQNPKEERTIKTHRVTILTAVDDKEANVLTVYCRSKGCTDEYVVKSVLNWMEQCGWGKVILQSDPENAIGDVVNAVVGRRLKPTEPRELPKGSKGSRGLVESMHFSVEGQLRTMVAALKRRYPGERIIAEQSSTASGVLK